MPPRAPSPGKSRPIYTPATLGPEQSMGYVMRRIVTLLAQDIDRRMEPVGLTNAQWLPLLKLHAGHATTVAELARECTLDAGATTRLLDRLEAKGLVRRERSVADRRVVTLALTEAGRAAARRIPAALCQAQNTALAGFSVTEWETLMTLLHRVLGNAQGHAGDGAAGADA